MDRLWAPWRHKYITRDSSKEEGCVFCRISQENKDNENFVFKRTDHSYAVLNIYPYNNGHILILPHRHIADLSDLNSDERYDLWDLLDQCKAQAKKLFNPDGFNIGINLGASAGAGYPDHVHIHLVPRWKGDVNFMTVTGETRVMSQSLEDLYKRLKDEN